ncbi:MAG: hypothetical protein H6741_07990 [Alphaproteobacteria bacterium]|nr:hypothetical protein [Alphaproteobacteria bacterium]MCB9792657.1 hypothetical protein [Alphaproteobacteria bacterium]
MSAHATRCPGCGAPLAAPRFHPVRCRCEACGHDQALELPTDGAPRSVTLGARALLGQRLWLEAFECRAAEPVRIVAACARCEGPLLLPADTPVESECQSCHRPARWALGEQLIDLIPVTSIHAQTWGGGMSLTWLPQPILGSSELPCPSCSAPLPPFEGRADCPSCGAHVQALTSCGQRFLPGVRIQGDDDGQRVDGWMPLSEALEHYLLRRQLRERSRRMTWRYLLAFLAGAVLMVSLGCSGMAIAFLSGVLLPERIQGLGAGFGVLVFLGAMVAPMVAVVGSILLNLVQYRRERDALLAGRALLSPRLPPPAAPSP